MMEWCSAFAAMNALEQASERSADRAAVEALIKLASQADSIGSESADRRYGAT